MGWNISTGPEYALSCLENRRKKVVGEPDEGKPHVRFDVAGNGNQVHKAQAPFPDPTSRQVGFAPPKRVESMLKQVPSNQPYLVPPTCG